MVYLLEDDDNIRNFVVYALNNSGIEAVGFASPTDFWKALEDKMPSVLLLDIMLPKQNGLEILKILKKSPLTKKLPVIMLTAKSSEYDKVVGLDEGADDYITKPFGTMELISRVKALLRRTNQEKNDVEYVYENLYVCPAKHIVKADEQNINLTLKEFELLNLFIENPGMVFTRDYILQKIWGYEFDGENRTVDVHIRTLRSKLGKSGDLIKTIRGVGYKIGD